MSQKPSSVDLRVSDFKRVPGFNYVLSVSVFKTEGSVQSCREYELETGSKLREGKGWLVLIEQSEAIAQPQEAG